MNPSDPPANASNRLASLHVNRSVEFLETLLGAFLENGWGSLSKRDLELLLFLLLERDGALERKASNYDIARRLRLTEGRVALLRKDAYARWRPLLEETTATVLARVFQSSLAKNQLEITMKFATARRMKDGFIPLLVEHPDDRAALEYAIKDVGGIPIHERNREVILIHHETLFAIAERHGLMPKDPRVVRDHMMAMCSEMKEEMATNHQKAGQLAGLDEAAIQVRMEQYKQEVQRILDSKTSLSDFLKLNVNKLTWRAARAALNDAGCIVTEQCLKATLTKLLWNMFAIP
jgi:hypothetical protein